MNKKGETEPISNIDNISIYNNPVINSPVQSKNKSILIISLALAIIIVLIALLITYNYFSNKNNIPSPISNNTNNILSNNPQSTNQTQVNTTQTKTNQTTKSPSSSSSSSSSSGSSGGPEANPYVCTPSCLGKQCGDDGCGGNCGICTNNLTCDYGSCVECTSDLNCDSGKICENRRCVSGCKDQCFVEGNFCDGNYVYECKMNLTSGCFYKTQKIYCGFKEICSSGECIREAFSASVIYEDNFEDGNYNVSGVDLINGLTWQNITGKIAITKSITNSSLSMSTKNTTFVSKELMPLSFTLEADIGIVWSHNIRIIFAYLDSNNYYYLAPTGNRGIYRVMNGKQERLDDLVFANYYSLPHSGLTIDRYKVYFDNSGSEIKISLGKKGYFDGLDYEYYLTDTNSEAVNKFKNVRIGFSELTKEFSDYYYAHIDNVVVYSGKKENQRTQEKRDYYVSNSGSDSNSGAASLPFRTLQRAASEVKAGETVYISPGIYREERVVPKFSGSPQSPITFKALDINNKPIFTGTVVVPASEWSSYNSNIYKTVLAWSPNSLFLDETPLFIAQEPNQNDPYDQMQTEYFLNVSSENNDTIPSAHYSLIDSLFFGSKNFPNLIGSRLLLHDNYINSIVNREILDYSSLEKKITVGFNPWVEVGYKSDRDDKYSLINSIDFLDKPGEYYVDKGKLKVNSWVESEGKVDVSVTKISGSGKAKSIRFYLFSGNYGVEITNSSALDNGQTLTYSLNITGRIDNIRNIYASVEVPEYYEVYVWPYQGFNPQDIEISKHTTLFLFSGYNENLIIDGFEVKHYQESGIDVSSSLGSARYLTIRNSDLHNNFGNGVSARCDIKHLIYDKPDITGSCSGLIIENSKLHHNYQNGASFGGGRNFTVRNCEIYKNLDNGIWSGNGGDFFLCVWDVYLYNNYIHHHGSDRTHPDGIQLYKTSNAFLDGNYFLQEGHQNVWISHCGPVWYRNNIAVNGVIGINSANESYTYNNVFYKSTLRYDAHQAESSPYEMNRTEISENKNNIFIDSSFTMTDYHDMDKNFNFENNFFAVPNLKYLYLPRYKNNIFYPARNSSVDFLEQFPRIFNDLINFTLADGSILNDAGTSGLHMADIDRNNNPRFQGVAIDIGATESYNPYSYKNCFNSIKDGNEEGVDCGGICKQDFDKDGYFIGLCSGNNDCNDSNININPGAPEICDAIDNNCDGIHHPDYSLDSDSDGKNNCIDNCPSVSNSLQEDFDLDNIGDSCDSITTYSDDFELRDFGTEDLSTQKTANGVSWENLIGKSIIILLTGSDGAGSKVMRAGGLGGNNTLTVTNQKFSEFNLSLEAGNAWSTDGGLVLYLQDKDNFYFLGIGNSGSSLINSTNYSAGGLYRVVNGQGVLIDSNYSLKLPHTGGVIERFNIQTKLENGLHFKISRINSTGYVFSDEFVDSSPAFTLGKIGFYKPYAQYHNIILDNIKIDIESSSYSSSSAYSSSSLPS
ncbi:MAG: MopE-related protein, partial [Candidatus Nanoarchaeia archaeon]